MTRIKLTALAALIMISCFSLGARADDDTDDAFKSWNDMKYYAAAHGVDTVDVDWSQIDQLCVGLKKSTADADQIAYNKCAYKKARINSSYLSDQTECSTLATGAYPDGLLKARTDTLTETDDRGVVHTYQRSTPPVSAADLQQQRSGYIVACMQKSGWADTNDWRSGKHSNPCQ